MTRIVEQYVSLETAVLGLVELILSFLIVEAFLSLPGGLDALSHASGLAINVTALGTTFALITIGAAVMIGLYRPDICLERRRLAANAAVAGTLAFPILLAVGGGFHIGLTGGVVFWLTILLLTCQAGILVTHTVFHAVVRPSRTVRRVLIIGPEQRAIRVAEMLRACRAQRFSPLIATGLPDPALGPLHAQGIWCVIVAGPTTDGPDADLLLDSKLRGTRVLSATAFCERHLGRIDLDSIDASWLLCADGFAHGRLTTMLKRGLDLAVSLTLLVLTLPVMLLTALMIRLDSAGPVLYRQQRSGLHGKTFTLYKFRSMRVDAESGGKPCWAQQEDPRVTRVGRIIRPMRIDELPQLINVLFGEMSMIGPRPERPHFVEQLARAIPLYRQRSYVKPGITGWAQVNYPYGASIEDAREKLAFDLFYVKNRGLLLDLLILLATIRVILFREGAR